jgi:hypothetical protein
MSYGSVVLIAPDLDYQRAVLASARVREYLIRNGYVGPERTACVPGREGGYPPGPRFAELFVEPPSSLDIECNGVEVEASGRCNFYDNGEIGFRIFCPSCRRQFDLDGDLVVWQQAMQEFYQGGAGLLRCKHCGNSAGVDRWTYDPPVGWSRFGISIWNCPHLKPDVIRTLAELVGSELAVFDGHF